MINYDSIAIVVLNWNGFENTVRCIESIFYYEPEFRNIIIIDNHSDDNSYIKLIHQYPNLKVIQTPINLGFAGGMNAGLILCQQIGYHYTILLNNDTQFIQIGTLSAYIDCFVHNPKVGAVSATIVNDLNGTNRQINFVSDARSLSKWFYRLIAPPYSSVSTDSPSIDNMTFIYREVPMLHGVALGIRLDAFKDGRFFNDEFFCYEEDRELLIRIRRLGYKLINIENVKIYHKWSGSSSKNSAFTTYYKARNLWYMRKVYYSFRYVIFSYFRLLLVSIKNNQFSAYIRGLFDGIKGYTGNSF